MPAAPSKVSRRTVRYIVEQCRAIAVESFGWSVEDWAKKAGIHYTTVYQLLGEKTKFPRLDTVVRLCTAVGLDLVTADRGTLELRINGAPKDAPVSVVKERVWL